MANLVLARSIARQKELATRVALGAGRRRMIQQALTEGLLLAAVGGARRTRARPLGRVGAGGARAGRSAAAAGISPDARMLWITLAVSVFTGIFVGLLPAITATRVAPHAALQENSRGTVGRVFRRRARAALVVAEVALAVTLTVGAGLLLRSFVSLTSVNPGFEPAQMLTWQMNLPSRIRTQEQRDSFYREFLERMKALPGRRERRRHQPAATRQHRADVVDHRRGPRTPVAEWPEVQFRRSLGDYFQTMGIPIIRGRMFNDGDTPSAPSVCMVNQTMAAKLFPGEDPVGRQLRNSQTGPPWTIIALIGDVKHGALDEEPQPEMYVSTYQGAMNSPYVVLRTSGNAAA